jgi:putative nucleotidyltransferase with HDIG domain
MKKIILLDKDTIEIDKIENLCEINQLSIVSRDTIEDFLQIIGLEVPALIIIDANFKEQNLINIIKKIKEKTEYNDVPFLILANSQDRQTIMELMKIGIKDFLLRPYLSKNLLQKIKDLINIESVLISYSKRSGDNKSTSPSLNVIEEEKFRKRILNEVENLPAFPVIVQKIIQIVNDPKSSASDFESYVKRDQTLTAKMLRMANSSFYNVKREIILIRDAVVTLGYNTVKTIAFAAGTSSIFRKSLPQYGLNSSGLWQHSYSVALTSRMIALDLGFDEDSAEEMFICGLLHDIGKLVLGKFIKTEERVYDYDINKIDICGAEKKITGFDHTELGEIITKKWQLPEKICYAVNYHHSLVEATSYNDEVAIVTLADYICKVLRIGFLTKNVVEPKLSEMVKSQLSIDDEKISKFKNEVSEKINDIARIAGI